MIECKAQPRFQSGPKGQLFKLELITIIIVSLLCLFWAPALWAQEETALAEGEITVKGLSLQVEPAQQSVPLNVSTVVNTGFTVDSPRLLKGMVVKAELQGRGLKSPITLSTLPNHPFSIPGLSVKGDYYLDNIRLEQDGKVLLKANPERALIQALDMIVTRVESRPLSLEEIREKGINITEDNFTVYNFSIGLLLHSKEVRYSFPVVYAGGDPYIAPINGGGHAPPQLGGGGGGAMTKQTVPFEMKPVAKTVMPGDGGGGTAPPRMTGVLVFNNDIAFLNQFFSVMFIVSNQAPDGSPLSLKDLKATMTFPDGLVEAETTPPHIVGTPIPVRCPGPDEKLGTADDLDVILATFSGMAEFLAEGKKEGSHVVTVDFEGTVAGMPGGDQQVKGSAKGMVIVKNPEFSVTFSHPRVVRTGEEFDIFVTIQNTSPVTANLLSLYMPAAQVSGCELLTDKTPENSSFESLEPGQSETVHYRMLSRQTGEVRASAIQNTAGVTPKLVLTAGVGEKGIPLSPDTLVLPMYAYSLPDEVLNAAMVSLGEAYSIATTPPGGVPAHLPPVGREIVKARVIDLTEAGQRVLYTPLDEDNDALRDLQYDEAVLKSVQVLTLDWCGNRYPEISFDMLRRMTTKDIKLNNQLSVLFNKELALMDAGAFQLEFARTCSYKKPFISAVLSFNGGSRCANLEIADYYDNELHGPAEDPVREIPFAEMFFLTAPNDSPVDFALLAHLDQKNFAPEDVVNSVPEKPFRIDITGIADGTFDLELIVPIIQEDEDGNYVNGGLRRVVFPDVPCTAGARSTLWVRYNGGAYTLEPEGQTGDPVSGTVTAVQEPALKLINAVQECEVDNAGHVVALYFNRAVDEQTVKAVKDTNGVDINAGNFYMERYQHKIDFTTPTKIYGRFLQPSERVVLIGLDNPISPFVQSTVTLGGLKDVRGGALEPSETVMPVTATIETPGGVVYGRVMSAEAKPVAGAFLRLGITLPSSGRLVNAYAMTNDKGFYQYDYVHIYDSGFEIEALRENPSAHTVVSSKLRQHGQALNMDIFFEAQGTVTGRVVYDDPKYYDQRLCTTWSEGNTCTTRITGVALDPGNSDRMFFAECDHLGYFTLKGVPLGGINISAHRWGGWTGRTSAVIAHANQQVDVSIAMENKDTGTVKGQVLMMDGSLPPIGLTLFLYRDGKPYRMIETHAPGQFIFEEVTLGTFTVYVQWRSLWELDGGEGLERFAVTAPPVSGELTQAGQVYETLIRLRGSGNITGSVVDHNLQPVENQVVYLKGMWLDGVTSDTEGSKGEFSITNVPLGNVFVATRDKNTGLEISTTVNLIEPGQVIRVTLALPEPPLDLQGQIQGHVYGPDNNAVGAGVLVQAFDSGYMPFASVTTGSNGDFTVPNVPVGDYVLAVDLGNQAGISRTRVTGQGFVAVSNINLIGTASLDIEVLNDSGDAGVMAHLEVRALGFAIRKGAQVGFVNSIINCDTDENGLKSVNGLFLGSYTVKGWNGFYPEGDLKQGTLDTVGQVKNVTLQMKPTGAVHITLLDEDNQTPVSDAVIHFKAKSLPMQQKSVGTGQDENGDPVGECTFTMVPPGVFSVEAEGKGEYLGKKVQVFGTMGRDGQVVDITPHFLSKGQVNITVKNPENNTVVDTAVVTLKSIDFPFEKHEEGNPGTDGVYPFPSIFEGDFIVSVFDPVTGLGGRANGTLAGNDAVSMEIDLKEYVTVSGRVFQPDHSTLAPNAQVTLIFANTGKAFGYMTTGDTGTFSFDYVPVGLSYVITVMEPFTGLKGSSTLSVDSGAEGEVTQDVRLIGRGTVEGFVYDGSGTQTAGTANINLKVGGTSMVLYSTTGENGYFQFENISEGSFTVTALDPATGLYARTTGIVEYEGHVVNADVYSQPTGSVTVSVLKAGGTAAFAPNVLLVSGEVEKSGQADANGVLTFTAVPMGSFTVTATETEGSRQDIGQAGGTLAGHDENLPVTVTFNGLGTVNGTLTQNSASAANYIVKLSNDNGIFQVATDVNGVFEFTAVRVGEFTLEAYPPSGSSSPLRASGSGAVQADGDIVAVPLALNDSGSVSGRVFLAGGTTPAEGVYMNLIAGEGSLAVLTDEQGMFEFPIVLVQENLVLKAVGGTGIGCARETFSLASGEQKSFDTVVLDNVRPQVTIEPANGLLEMPQNTGFTLTFSEDMNTDTFDANILVKIGNLDVTARDFDRTVTSGGVAFTPKADLPSFTSYTVTTTYDVTDMAGNPLEYAASSTFRTVDKVPPAVLAIDPPDNASGIVPTTGFTVNVTFTEPINTPAFSLANITLRKDGVILPGGSLSWAMNDTVLQFKPAEVLFQDGEYTVTVQGAVDKVGNIQSAGFTSSFFSIDTIAPTFELSTASTSVIEGSGVTVTAVNLSADVKTVYFYLNGTLEKTDTTNVRNFTFNAPYYQDTGDQFTVSAYAVDQAGNQGNQVNLPFTLLIDTPPTVSLTPPGSLTVVPCQRVGFGIIAQDDLELTSVALEGQTGTTVLGLSKTLAGVADYTGTLYLEIPRDIAPGSTISVTGKAVDRGARSASSIPPVTLQVRADAEAPTIEIFTEHAVYNKDDTIVATAVASDDVSVELIRIFMDGQEVKSCPNLCGQDIDCVYDQYVVPYLEQEQEVLLEAEAVDLAGNVSARASCTVTLKREINATAPGIELIAPTNGTLVFPGENLKVKVNTSDPNGISGVELAVNGQAETLTWTNNGDIYETVYTVPAATPGGGTLSLRITSTDDGGETNFVQTTVAAISSPYHILDADTLIGEADGTYDGEDRTLVIRGDNVTVTMNGEHVFKNLLVKESAVLTHGEATTVTHEHLELSVTGQVAVAVDAKLNAGAKGYLGAHRGDNGTHYGFTHGENPPVQGSHLYTGGSYGGYGGYDDGFQRDEVYGNPYHPVTHGSGGGGSNTGSYAPGSGGGVLKITDAEIIVDGGIHANGGSTIGGTCGGGSGGSILLEASTLKGSGTISANGGNSSNRGAGGGGRIAVYYDTLSEALKPNINAYGGLYDLDQTHSRNGGAGTVYLKQQGQPGELVIDNRGLKNTGGTPIAPDASGTVTGLTSHSIIDSNADFAVDSLVGMRLQPNTERTETYLITSNSGTEISIEPVVDLIADNITTVGKQYRVKAGSNILLESGLSRLTGEVGVGDLTLLSGAELVLDGVLEADRLHLQSGGKITHSPATTTAVYSLKIIADELLVDEGGEINVSSRGYLGGYRGDNAGNYGLTLGNVQGSANGSGASHGGSGGKSESYAFNLQYGSVLSPALPGSGGGCGHTTYPGGSGGGVIHLEADEFRLDGDIVADGGNAGNLSGGGSGGSIYISAGNLHGTGAVRAHGGDGSNRGGGGGGRIALYYQTADTALLNTVTAYGGLNTNISMPEPEYDGSAGTVYLQQQGQTGTLVINNNGNLSHNPMIFPVIPPAVLTAVSGSVLENTGAQYMPQSLVGMKLLVDGDDTGNPYVITANTGTTITVDKDFTAGIATGAGYRGIAVLDAHVRVINTRAEMMGQVEIQSLTLLDNAVLSHPVVTGNGLTQLFIDAETVSIDATSKIDIGNRGYPGGFNSGNSSNYGVTYSGVETEGSYFYAGGSHGGLGGQPEYPQGTDCPAAGAYGSLYEPLLPGSGGGSGNDSSSYHGGNGGGALRIQGDTLVLRGEIKANGGNGTAYSGAGAGGSIYLRVRHLRGEGQVQANGGNCHGKGAGGGGRIALYYETLEALSSPEAVPAFSTAGITAYGGLNTLTGGAAETNGGAGTVYIKDTVRGQDELTVDNNGTAGRAHTTPLPSVALSGTASTSTALSAQVLTDGGAAFIENSLAGIKLNPNFVGTTGNYLYTIISNTATQCFTLPAEGDMTEQANVNSPYIGEHHLHKLTVTGNAALFTFDRFEIGAGGLTVDTGSTLTSQNLNQ